MKTIFCILILTGCAHANRAEARGAVEVTAAAVKVGDETCGKYAIEKQDTELARACEAAYNDARALVLTAADGVDSWDEGKRQGVTCAIVHASEKLAVTANELRQRKLKVPSVIDDALSLVRSLGKCP